MFIFFSVIGIVVWAALWGAIRWERTMQETHPPDPSTAAMTDGKATEEMLDPGWPPTADP